MLRKALLPLLLIIAAALLLTAAAYFYEAKWGATGPFHDEHEHGHQH